MLFIDGKHGWGWVVVDSVCASREKAKQIDCNERRTLLKPLRLRVTFLKTNECVCHAVTLL